MEEFDPERSNLYLFASLNGSQVNVLEHPTTTELRL